MGRWNLCLVTVTVMVLLPVLALALDGEGEGAARWQDKVDPWVLDHGRSGDTEFIVFLEEQADLSGARSLPSKLDKGRLVFEALTETARRSQPPVLAELAVRGVEYHEYWVANMIWVRGGLDTVQAMAERSDVRRVHANPAVRLHEPVSVGEPAGDSPRAVEWNIALVNAPDVWALGITGTGAVVAGQDTGYRWDHAALVNQYRGGPAGNHDYNWHDAIHSGGGSCGADSPFPCDDHGHGTHTMGTAVGDDGGSNQIGMAPTAKWIGCRNMDQGVGTPTTYAECYQFFIAPTDLNGQNPSPALAPDVINNSWGCPPSEGCTDPDVLLTVVQSVRAAGIVTAHSAGNSGWSCSTVEDPAAIYDESFTVAATDISDDIAYFSSRGPVTVDGSNRMKPDISAPGVDIRSSTRDGGYQGGWQGTSMAAPHVAGLVALVISGNPGLAGDVDMVEDIIEATAVPLTTSQGCGGDGPDDVPNNVYGWGRIDALAAVNYSLDFLVEATPAELAVCVPSDAPFDINVTQFQGFAEPVTLSTSGLPSGATASFSVNPVIPPGTSQLTVGTAGATAGSSDFDIIGTASPSGIVHQTTVHLDIYDQSPGGVTLVSPANGAGDVALLPTLTWGAAAQAASYQVQVADDPGFAAIVYASTSSETTHTLTSALEPTTTYWWRVRAVNPCGSGGFSSPFSFTTRQVPAILVVDDDDNTPDVRSVYTGTLDALSLFYDVWDTGNSDNEPSPGELGQYSTVVWFTGEEFGGSAGPGAAGEAALAAWLDGNGLCLFLSSQDYYWDRGMTSFMASHLGLSTASNDVDQSSVTGTGTLFAGLGPYSLDYPFSNYSDQLNPGGSAEVAFVGNQGTAAIAKIDSEYTTTFWGFPFEALPTAGDRQAAMQAFLDACVVPDPPLFADGFESGDSSSWSVTAP